MIITTFPVIFFIVQTSRPADVGTFSNVQKITSAISSDELS